MKYTKYKKKMINLQLSKTGDYYNVANQYSQTLNNEKKLIKICQMIFLKKLLKN